MSVGVILDLVRTLDCHHHLADHLLGHLHQVIVVSISHVELHSCELRVVCEVNTLIPELATHLVNTLNAAHNQLLQEQFWCNAHVHVLLEVVVMCHERLGCGSTWDQVHHRCLHLKEATVVKEPAHKLDDLGAGVEDATHFRVADEVQISLTVACLLILETVMCLGRHVQARRKHLERLGEDRELALFAFARVAHHTNDVTTLGVVVDCLESSQVQVAVANIRHELDLLALPVQVIEQQLGARCALAVDAACHGHSHVLQL
mmetsp:Transcript_13576/g.23845  ORF Transcript_13576/g.23845 Transcript_13576/m.23845 type:complete len:261 (+) Transcript_13576:993-1775(+)